MSSAPMLPMSDIIDVVVSINPIAPAVPTFNQGLITGTSVVIPSVGGPGTNRMRLYSSLSQMLTDGFTNTSPEYLAAQIYFSQTVPPQFVWVGRQDLTAVVGVAIHVGAAGTGYAVGDTFSIAGGTTLAVGQVTTVNAGVPTAIAVVGLSSGTGYATGSNVATIALTGVGVGLHVDTTVGESVLIALEQCDLANMQWYGCMATGAVTADHEAVAAWLQSKTTTPRFYFAQTSDTAVLTGATGNLLSVLKAANYSRIFVIYSTTQGGTFPNNIYAAAAVMGLAMGLNTGLANSNFTLAHKTLVGIGVEPLTQNQVNTIAGTNGVGYGNCGNVYVNFGNTYSWLEQGILPNGQQFQNTLQLDMLSSDIQYSGAAVLASNVNIPQDDSGENMLLNAVNGAAQRSFNRGFLAKGLSWQGAPILNLVPGVTLPNGYLAQAQPFRNQSASDRALGKAMPIYLAVITAGTVLSLIVQVNAQIA